MTDLTRKDSSQASDEADASEKVFHASKTCPECGSKLWAAAEGGGWQCPNPDCPAQVRRWLQHWCAADVMDIAGGDEKMIGLLVQHGLVRDVAELYRLKVKELAALPGFTSPRRKSFFTPSLRA